MRKSVISLVGGVFLSLLTFTFTACGGVDNPLEELVNTNPEAAEEVFNFLDILEVDSRLVVKFKLNENNTETSCTVTIKNKGNNNYEIESCEGLDPELFEFALNEDKTKLILTCYEEGDEEAGPARFQFFFNPQEKSFYIVNGLNEDITFDGKVTVNKIEGTLTDECPDKATIQLWYTIDYDLECRAGTRNAGGFGNSAGSLIVRYKNGETWQNVIDRYNASLFSGLVSLFEEPEGPEYPIIQVYSKKFDENYNDPDGESSDGLFTLMYDNTNYVSPSQKIGLKDDEAFTSDYPAIGLVTIRYE